MRKQFLFFAFYPLLVCFFVPLILEINVQLFRHTLLIQRWT